MAVELLLLTFLLIIPLPANTTIRNNSRSRGAPEEQHHQADEEVASCLFLPHHDHYRDALRTKASTASSADHLDCNNDREEETDDEQRSFLLVEERTTTR